MASLIGMDVSAGAALDAAFSQPKPTKAEGAAKQFEALLIDQMLKSARESSPSGLGDEDETTGAGPMLDMADQQFSQVLANNGGLGLAQMLVKGLNQGEQNANQQQSAVR